MTTSSLGYLFFSSFVFAADSFCRASSLDLQVSGRQPGNTAPLPQGGFLSGSLRSRLHPSASISFYSSAVLALIAIVTANDAVAAAAISDAFFPSASTSFASIGLRHLKAMSAFEWALATLGLCWL